MLNRLFNKGSKSAAAGPPGSQAQPHGGAAAASHEEPVGGGFFNLPPMVAAKPPGAYGGNTTASPGLSGVPPATAVGGGAPPMQATFSRPTHLPGASSSYQPQHPPHHHQPQQQQQQQQQQHVPAYTHSSSYDAPAAAASTSSTSASSSIDMFGGMALKQPVSVVAPPTNAAPIGGNLFSGLDLVSGGSSSASSLAPPAPLQQQPQPTTDRRKSTTRTFNYLDVAAAAGATLHDASSRTSSTTSAHSAGAASSSSTTTATRTTSKVVKKKKTKSFRPGFGRQLSDESAAALQRGDLSASELAAAASTNAESESQMQAPRIATQATDLAHLLPPVGGGSSSMLSGLTVHRRTSAGASATTTTTSSSSSVLAGLTVHTPATTAETTTTQLETERSSVLAGLHVHPPPTTTTIAEPFTAAAAVESPSAAPQPLPPSVHVPETPATRLQSTLRDFYASAVTFRTQLSKFADDDARLTARKQFLTNQLAQYALDLRDVDAQQQHAVDIEDFDKAEALNATLSSVKHCMTLSESDVRKNEQELQATAKATERAFANQLRSTKGTMRELEKFRDDQVAARDALRLESQTYNDHETQHFALEAARIDAELMHVRASLEHVEAEKVAIDAAIDAQCRDELALQAQLQQDKDVVDLRIQELERQLQIERANAQKLQVAIDKTQKDVDAVRSRYARQLKRLADREAGIETTKAEVEADGALLKAHKRAFVDRLDAFDNDIAHCTTHIQRVKFEMRAAVVLTSVLEAQETRRDQTSVRKKQQQAERSVVADAAAIAAQSVALLTQQQLELEKALAMHRNAIASAASMIPRLEADKKAAAAQRNFKDAARLSKDIKALEKDRATAEEMVEVVEMELADLAERIAKREVEATDKEAELKALDAQFARVTLSELWNEAKHLRKAERRLRKRRTTGSFDDNEEKDDEKDFVASALLLVHAELEACTAQIDALESQFDVHDPHAADDEEEDEDDEEESDDDDEEDARFDSKRMRATGNTDRVDAVHADDAIIDGAVDSPEALDAIATKLEALETLIDEATQNEEYELAARLDEEMDALQQRRQALAAALAPPQQQQQQDDDDDGEEDDKDDDKDDKDDKDDDDDDSDNGHHVELASPQAPAFVEVDANDTMTTATTQSQQHDAQTIGELEAELTALRARIIHVEDDIDEATQHEEYERAAAFDDELQELRSEQHAIEQLLDAARALDEAPQPSSLFGGLALSGANAIVSTVEMTTATTPATASSTQATTQTFATVTTTALDSPTASRVAGVDSFFGGLHVEGKTNNGDGSATIHYPSPASSMFGGLQLSSNNAVSADAHAIAHDDATVSTVTQAIAVLRDNDMDTDTDDVRRMEEDAAAAAAPTASAIATEFQTLVRGASNESNELANEVPLPVDTVVDSDKDVDALAPPVAIPDASSNSSSSMFAGLHVSIASSNGSGSGNHENHEMHERTASGSSLHDDVDAHSSDSPMTIHELSHHSLASDDDTDDGSLHSSIASSHQSAASSSFADISFTATGVTTLTTEMMPAVTSETTDSSSNSMFGGLSFVAPPPVAMPTALLDAHRSESGMDLELDGVDHSVDMSATSTTTAHAPTEL